MKQTNNPIHVQSPGEYPGQNTKLEFSNPSPNPEKPQSLKYGKIREPFPFLHIIMDSPALQKKLDQGTTTFLSQVILSFPQNIQSQKTVKSWKMFFQIQLH